MIDFTNCPEDFKGCLERYACDRIAPGHFIRAVLENNMMQAMRRADLRSQRLLPELCKFIYNELPVACYGSPESVTVWLSERVLK